MYFRLAPNPTLNVFVDGVDIGHPTYNNYRADIATLFPGYANNSNGASDYFYLDTTGYADGVHTIYWTARDNAGNTDGIGSRYFTINNSGTNSMKQTQKEPVGLNAELSRIPLDNSEPIRVKQSFNRNGSPQEVQPDETGKRGEVIKELERMVLHLSHQSQGKYNGYMKVGSRLMALPVGSTLDPENGIFHWIPAHGFLGPFHLVFVETRPDGTITKKEIFVEIVPRTAVRKGD